MRFATMVFVTAILGTAVMIGSPEDIATFLERQFIGAHHNASNPVPTNDMNDVYRR